MNRALLLAAILLAPIAAEAAKLKPYAAVSGPVVRLSDLWEGVTDDKDLGPAPGPGERITVLAPQLAAIARQFGVDWRPNASADRVILERRGRALTRDDVNPAIRRALTGAGASPEADVELGAFTAPLISQDAALRVAVAQIDLDKLSGRFAAQLDIAAGDGPNTQLRVTGRIQDMVDLPVVRHRVMPGEVVTAADLEWARLPRSFARGEVVHLPGEAVGLSAKQSIAPNQPIPVADLGHPVVVQKGNEMALTLESPGLSLTARGIAAEPGGIGDHIRVVNEYARMTVEAVIIAPGQGRVVPGTARPATRMVAAR